METKDILLDEEADKLFRELGGIDTSDKTIPSGYRPEDLDEGLREEEARLDTYRVLLVELSHLLSAYFRDVQYWEEAKAETEHFAAIVGTLRELAQMPDHDGSVLVRYRGSPSDPKISVVNDYVILFGDLMLDLDMMPSVIKRQGTRASHLGGRLNKAFQVFSDTGINNIHLNVMAENPASLEHLLICLRILSRYNQALENDSPIVFSKNDDRISLPICLDEKRKADINLTLVAGLNGVNTQTMETLVRKIEQLMERADAASSWEPHASIYNAMFTVKQLKDKLIEPPLAVNNARWLMVDRSYDGISREKAQVVRFVVDKFGGTPHDTVRVIDSVYSNDYGGVNTKHLVSRLESATDLISNIEEEEKGSQFEQEVLRNVQGRMGQVDDAVYDDLMVQKDTVAYQRDGEETVLSHLNAKLIRMIQFYIRRSKTRQKIKNIVSEPIDFDARDYETIGRDFGIPSEAAENLISLLKGCFDAEGHFHRSIFEKNIPEFIRHERKVFEFLWHYTKETPHRNDRIAFLNSLQLLTAQMRKPHRAVYALLDDFYHDPTKINYSDRNGLMLATLFLRKYNKELNLDIELTPEEILLVKEGLNEEVVRLTSTMIDKAQANFFDKVRTIRHSIFRALEGDSDDEQTMTFKYLLSLEREAHIFLSLLRGTTARSVVRNAAKVYGFPESAVYHLTESRKHLQALLQHLKVVIRGLARVGGRKDLALLEEIRSSEGGFLNLGKDAQYEELVKRTMEWVDVARYNLANGG